MESAYQLSCREVAAIVLDAEFQELAPRPSADEQALLAAALHRDGCREVLIVWPCHGRKILLVGYELFPTLKLYGIPFSVIDKELCSRAAARMFVIKHLLERQNLSALGVSYLRGLRYQAEKRPDGGDRRHSSPSGKTAEALGDILHVSPRTIRRDAEVSAAVERIVSVCGKDAKELLLARDSPLGRAELLALARLADTRQKAVVFQWRIEGKLPRRWQNGEGESTITLPRLPAEFARTLLRRVGPERAKEYQVALTAELDTASQTFSADCPIANPSNAVPVCFCS